MKAGKFLKKLDKMESNIRLILIKIAKNEFKFIAFCFIIDYESKEDLFCININLMKGVKFDFPVDDSCWGNQI
ncbi:MAG: hypothetical protein ACOC2O_01645 [Bacillota bacterium]